MKPKYPNTAGSSLIIKNFKLSANLKPEYKHSYHINKAVILCILLLLCLYRLKRIPETKLRKFWRNISIQIYTCSCCKGSFSSTQIGLFAVPFDSVRWCQHSEWHWIGCKAPCSTHLLMQLGLRFTTARQHEYVITQCAICEQHSQIMSHYF